MRSMMRREGRAAVHVQADASDNFRFAKVVTSPDGEGWAS